MGINSKDGYQSLIDLRDHLMRLQSDLSLSQLVALMTVAVEPGLSVNDLSDRLGIPQQSASRYVAVLTGRYQSELSDGPIEALINQQINEIDPRKRALYLTEAGHALMSAILGSREG